VELNIFGGNPELHPSFLRIVQAAKNIGWKVTTTTTGKRFLAEPDFLSKFLKKTPHLLAFSADDFEDIDELKQLLSLSLKEIKTIWFKINPLYGQRKKAYESVYVAKLAQKTPGFCLLLFNIVVHPGNLFFVKKMIELLHQAFPDAIINPYPAQSSFAYGLPIWKKKHLPQLKEFIDFMIKNQTAQVGNKKKTYVPRLHYWLFLKSSLLIKASHFQFSRFLSGNYLWNCYRQPGAGRYFQAGSSAKKLTEVCRVGSHPGCFWNNTTITDNERQLWKMSIKEIAQYILDDKPRMAKKRKKPCPGCIMPRLLFDGISTELGMKPELVPAYLQLRKEYLKF